MSITLLPGCQMKLSEILGISASYAANFYQKLKISKCCGRAKDFLKTCKVQQLKTMTFFWRGREGREGGEGEGSKQGKHGSWGKIIGASQFECLNLFLPALLILVNQVHIQGKES